jgi:hypothetical protein
MSDELPLQSVPPPDNPAHLSDDELIERLRDHRRGTGEWAAVLGEIQRRSDRQAGDARFKAALASADDGVERPAYRPPEADGPEL